MTALTLNHEVVMPRIGDPPHPALLLLHGRGANERDLLPLVDDLDPRLLIISPRAPFSFPGGGYFWYDLDPQGVGYPEAKTFARSLDALESLIAEVTTTYPIDPARVYIGGFSMGAAMSATLALTLPDRIAGAVVLSGYLPLYAGLEFRTDDVAGHPIFQAHGTFDPVIPVIGGQMTRDYLATTPVDLTYREYQMGHEVGYQELLDLATWLTAVLDAGSRTERVS